MQGIKKTVLYLDDEKPNLFLFGITFRKQLDVITVDNITEAFELIDRHTEIDCVISDLKMPKMSGLEFVTRAKEKRPDISYYILSGFEEPDDVREAIEAGEIKAYIKKPFDKQNILSLFSN